MIFSILICWHIISEYDKIRIIKIYELNQFVVVLSVSHMDPGDVSESVLGYLHEIAEWKI